MKLRNKKTGEIVEFRYLQSDYVAPLVLTTYENDKPEMYSYTSLAELNEEWEDAPEEPKENGLDNIVALIEAYSSHDSERYPKEIVEKLKAWKRLKDKGFRFQFWHSSYAGDNISFFIDWINADSKKEIEEDLDLLFGGEE